MTPNTLSFAVEPLNAPTQMVLATIPVIDGRRLTDILIEFERKHGFTPAGAYGGLVFEQFNFGPLGRYFRQDFDADDKAFWADGIYVLGCECGEVGCWPVKCFVTSDRTTIVWDRFWQPQRPDRVYAELGLFVFDATQYVNAVADLQTRFQAVY